MYAETAQEATMQAALCLKYAEMCLWDEDDEAADWLDQYKKLRQDGTLEPDDVMPVGMSAKPVYRGDEWYAVLCRVFDRLFPAPK